MITEAKFIPITPKKIPENFFFLLDKILEKSKFLIYRVDEFNFSLEHWYKTKAIYQANGGEVILHSKLRDKTLDYKYLHLTSDHLIETNELSSSVTGASCHNEKEILKASDLGLDYIFISPVKDVENKSPALGWNHFSKLAKLFPGPSFALGGLEQKDFKIAHRHGAQGIASIRGFFNLQNEIDPKR